MNQKTKMNRAATVLGVAAAAALMLVSPAGLFAQGVREIPDSVYYNGKVITVDSANSTKEAFAVK